MHQYLLMTTQIKTALIAWIMIAFVAGVMLGDHGVGPAYRKQQQEEKRLRKELETEKKNVLELRKGLSEERRKFEREINLSLARIDSLNAIHSERESHYQKQIRDLKKRTVRQLEDEAEAIYREHGDKHQ
jgi:predicted RNase H-like nuclease (RuvC/YqgF family)